MICSTTGSGSMWTTTRRSKLITGPRMKLSTPLRRSSASNKTRSNARRYEKLFQAALGGTDLWSSGGPVTCFSLAAKLCGTKPKRYSSSGTRSTFQIYRFPSLPPERQQKTKRLLQRSCTNWANSRPRA